jgi:hypothetical protein
MSSAARCRSLAAAIESEKGRKSQAREELLPVARRRYRTTAGVQIAMSGIYAAAASAVTAAAAGAGPGGVVALPVYEGRWFKVSVEVNAIQLVADLLVLLSGWNAPYFYGSMHIKLTSEQVATIRAKYKDNVELKEDKNLSNQAQLVVEDSWDNKDTDIDLFVMAMCKNKDDEQSDEEFAKCFLSLFKTDARGALRMTKKLHTDVKMFAVRFAHKIKVLSGGLQPLVPRFTNNPDNNKLEMFRLFVAAYPAYCNLTKSAGWDNKFFWKYAIIEEDDDDQQELDEEMRNKRKRVTGEV